MIPPGAEFFKKADKAIKFAQNLDAKKASLDEATYNEKKAKLDDFVSKLIDEHLKWLDKSVPDIIEKLLNVNEKRSKKIITEKVALEQHQILFSQRATLEADLERFPTISNEDYLKQIFEDVEQVKKDLLKAEKERKFWRIPDDSSSLPRWVQAICGLYLLIAVIPGVITFAPWISLMFIIIFSVIFSIWTVILNIVLHKFHVAGTSFIKSFSCVMLQAAFAFEIGAIAFFFPPFILLIFLSSAYSISEIYKMDLKTGLIIAVVSNMLIGLVAAITFLMVIIPAVGSILVISAM